MDVLVSEAQVIKMRVAQGALKRGCFAPQVRVRRGGKAGGNGQGLWQQVSKVWLPLPCLAWTVCGLLIISCSCCCARCCCLPALPALPAGQGAAWAGGAAGALLCWLHRAGIGVPAREQHRWVGGWVGGRAGGRVGGRVGGWVSSEV